MACVRGRRFFTQHALSTLIAFDRQFLVSRRTYDISPATARSSSRRRMSTPCVSLPRCQVIEGFGLRPSTMCFHDNAHRSAADLLRYTQHDELRSPYDGIKGRSLCAFFDVAGQPAAAGRGLAGCMLMIVGGVLGHLQRRLLKPRAEPSRLPACFARLFICKCAHQLKAEVMHSSVCNHG